MESQEDQIKFAFSKVKEDINFLNEELLLIKVHLSEFKEQLTSFDHIQKEIKNTLSTLQQIISSNPMNPTNNPTVPKEIEGLKDQNLIFSIGNKGVPTDSQTVRQSDSQTENNLPLSIREPPLPQFKTIDKEIKEASEILESLDHLKKEIRLKFKHLTHQEMLVFSTIYQLEEQNNHEISYPLVSKLLKLSESSIRDYVHRMINKGIPLKKEKVNNKRILLSISPELKRIAPLSTIIRLREL